MMRQASPTELLAVAQAVTTACDLRQPDPASYALLMGGLGLIGFVARRSPVKNAYLKSLLGKIFR